MSDIDVAVIGAGPYGLSLSAYLTKLGVGHVVFGSPMSFWRESVPPGMLLKSEGESSDLFDPKHTFPIRKYYDELSRPFESHTIIPSDIFVEYGLEFQKRFVPDVDPRKVTNVCRSGGYFLLTLQDGTVVKAARVVVATGIRDYAYIPDNLSGVPKEYLTHCVEYGPIDAFVGRKVVVIGGGASAVDLAWSLNEHGSEVTLVCRGQQIKFRGGPKPRKWYSAIRSPDSPIGGGWKLWFYANAPNIFRLFPEQTRLRIVRNTLGPAPGWFMTDRVSGRLPIFSGLQVTEAQVLEGKVHLKTKSNDGQVGELVADHVIAATGYRVDVKKLAFLEAGLKDEVRLAEGAPVLSANFESSVPGLYFIGVAAAATFGPVARFVAGAGFTVRRLAPQLARSRRMVRAYSDLSKVQVAK